MTDKTKEIPLGPQAATTETPIEDQFREGPGAERPQPSMEEMEAIFDRTLPFMRKREEHNRLTIAMYEQDLLLGRITLMDIPGLLGLEMAVRDINAEGFLAQFRASQQQAMEDHKKAQEEQKEKEKENSIASSETATGEKK